MIQELWVPGPLPGLNEVLESAKGAGGSGARYSRLKDTWTTHVWAHARAARLRAMNGRVHLRFDWKEKDKRRDPDNISAAGRKFVLDGLVKAGVIGGDGWKFVFGWDESFDIDERPGVRIVLTSAEKYEERDGK